MAVKAGGDINCGPEYSQLVNATQHGFITEAELDVSIRRLMRRRMQTGDLDALGSDGKQQTPYAKIPVNQIDTPEHKAVAHRLVRESIVLLTNNHRQTAATTNVNQSHPAGTPGASVWLMCSSCCPQAMLCELCLLQPCAEMRVRLATLTSYLRK